MNYPNHSKNGFADLTAVRVRLLRDHFFNRDDVVAVKLENACPMELGGGLDRQTGRVECP